MQHILNLISDDRYTQHMAEQFLHKKWPQINETTKISYTKECVVYMAEMPSQHVFNNMKRVAISGWRRLKQIAMRPTLAQLDDPQERIAYSHRLWLAIIKAPMYIFWRITGDLRGSELVPDPSVRMPPIFRRELQLEVFGWQLDYAGYMHKDATRSYIVCGYDATTDTLFIRR